MMEQKILIRQIGNLIMELNDLTDLNAAYHLIERVKSEIAELELKLQSL